MADYTNYTRQGVQTYTTTRSIQESQTVTIGTGPPLIGVSLVKRAVRPSCHPIAESGLVDCDPVEVPRSVDGLRFMTHCAVQWPDIRFAGFEVSEWLHGEEHLTTFIGGTQIDPYGNVNSTCIGGYNNPKIHFAGSGDANGIATYCNAVIMMQH